MDALSRLSKPRGGVALPEVVDIHVLRDPPRSIHTRKIERVEEGDIMHNLRANPDRLSDAIQQFQRGVNVQGSVDYSGRNGLGSKTHHLARRNPHTSYNVMADGAFRPPMVRMEDTLPLSRQKRDWFAVNSGVSLGASGIGMPKHTVNEYTIDHEPLRATIHPSFAYTIGQGGRNTYAGNAVMDPLTWAVTSGVARPGGTGRPGGAAAAVPKMLAADATARAMDVAAQASAAGLGTHFGGRGAGASGWNPVDKVSYAVASGLGGADASVTRTLMNTDGTARQMARNVLSDDELLHVAAGTNIAAPYHTMNLEDTRYSDTHMVRTRPNMAVNTRIFYEMQQQPDVLAPILDRSRPVVSAFAAPNRANNMADWMTSVTLKEHGVHAGATGHGYSDASGLVARSTLGMDRRSLNPSTLKHSRTQQLQSRLRRAHASRERAANVDAMTGNVGFPARLPAQT